MTKKSKSRVRYFSAFSGIGGFELGIQYALSTSKGEKQRGNKVTRAMHGKQPMASECVGYSEIDTFADKIYKAHFPTHKNYGDITKIKTEELPDFDLLVGGFPCQSFSIAGKRGGFSDTRGTLFFELARLLKDKKPRLFVFENVKGLLSHEGGKTFTTIITTLDELGYDCQWQVLNSKYHGVPQNRERVIIIGHLRETSRPQVFPFREDSEEVTERGVYTGTLTGRYPASQREGTYIEENGHRSGEIEKVNNPTHSNNRVYKKEGIGPALNTMQGGNRQPKIKEGLRVRRLTPVECERLQGFPDGWTERGHWIDTDKKGMPYTRLAMISDSQRYKSLGNAVTVNVIKAVMEKLLQ